VDDGRVDDGGLTCTLKVLLGSLVKLVQPAWHGETYSSPSSPHTGAYADSEHEQLAQHVDRDLEEVKVQTKCQQTQNRVLKDFPVF